jgi:DNA-binding transcriptional regulator GbsR (MarR family)
MARHPTVLKTIMGLLNKQPMTSSEIRRKTKFSRKAIWQYLGIAQKEHLVEQDRLKCYRLTLLGKSAFSSFAERPSDKTIWQIQSQVIDNIGWTSNRPSAECTLMTKDAQKIKEIDNQTAYDVRYKLELPTNATAIKSSLANIVDTVLETIGKTKGLGLYTVRNGELAESLTPFNIQEQRPGYDFLKRYTKLADTTFNILIEFNGKKWIKAQKPNEVKKHAYDNRKSFAEYYSKQILSHDKWKRINEALQILADKNDWNKVKNNVKWSHLFENEEELTKHLSQHFESYGKKSNPKEVVDKAFESGILQTQNKRLIHLTLDPDPKKIQQFYSLLDS